MPSVVIGAGLIVRSCAIVFSAADLDLVTAEGLARRCCFLGPFATIDLNAPEGIADHCARFGPFYQRGRAAPPAPAVWDADGIAMVVSDLASSPSRTISGQAVDVCGDRQALS